LEISKIRQVLPAASIECTARPIAASSSGADRIAVPEA
jgi:hypothetical protein